MGRPRNYDEHHARMGAMRAFWRSGYEGTSIVDLEAATGVGRRQLYNEHGDKRGLFLRAMADFESATADLLLKDLEAPDAGLREVLDALPLLIRSGLRTNTLGCLLCNTACESIGVTDDEVRNRILTFWHRMDVAYASALRNAVAAGDIRMTARRIERVARRFRAAHVAICLMRRAGEPEPVLIDVAREAAEAVRDREG
ncbi:MAG: TetR family transcriptional regulator [Planctomycetota bacterium]